MGYIKKHSVDKVLDASHIEEVIGDFVKDLKRKGSGYEALSPIIKEKSPSFKVSIVKQIYKDFASTKGGNVVNFLIEYQGMSYPEAIEYIAKKYNIKLEYENVEFSEKKKIQLEEKDILRKVLVLVHELYKAQYKQLPIDHIARKEVQQKREYNEEDIIDWGIGFAPENFLYEKIKASGYITQAEKLGLITIQIDRQNKWDNYSNRVIYPIHDKNGLLIGFAGRDVSGKKNTGKWINPKVDDENILYNKSTVWYGMHKAKTHIRKSGEAFLCEGYNDVIAAHRYGLENTVASCGTAITDGQINELSKLCKKVVFWMDPDRAGIEAVLKHIPRFLKANFRTEVIVSDLDPDDYVRKYHDMISLSGGLDTMFKTPGVRKDGFGLLIDEYIKKDFLEIEKKLSQEKLILTNYENVYTTGKEKLIIERNSIEGDLLAANNLLNEIALIKDKKSEEYKDQLKTTTTLKGQLESKKHDIKNYIESAEFKIQKRIVNDLTIQFDDAFKNSEIKRAAGAKKLCADIINVENQAYSQIYLGWIQEQSKISKATLNSWIKEIRSDNSEEIEENDEYEYELPKNVKIPFKDLELTIKTYGMFMANHQIYMALPETRRKVYFSSISNFEISILQHMNDEKFPKKLIRVKNIHGKETIFDTPSESINTPQAFNTVITNHGNYRFKGNNSDLNTLLTYLFDHMGDGKKIDTLGFQKSSKVWVWNNKVIDEDGLEIPMDENGMFVYKNIHYYVPSANRIYKDNSSKFSAQKKFIVLENSLSFELYMQKVIKVHREHAIPALLFAIASLFQDIVAAEVKSFPILFLYGPGSSGKDGLARVVQSFTGIPQTPISLESGASTAKAGIREFAQFINSFGHLSEYYKGDTKLDGTLKGLWDRNGYKLGTLDSKVSTDVVEIESSVILTGNQFPEKEALISRLIWNEITKFQFSEEEMKEYDELEDMTDEGVSGYSNKILAYRKVYKANFSKKYRFWKGFLQEKFKEPKVRMLGNLAVLGATFEIFRDMCEYVHFPFSQEDMLKNFKRELEHQTAKMNSASIMIRFWQCFITALRGNVNDRIQVGHIVNIEGNTLFFNWTHVYSHINKHWYLQYRESSPVMATFKEEFEKEGLILENKTKHSFDHGREANRTSAVGVNLLKIPEETREDIIGYIMFQKSEGSIFPSLPPGQTALPITDFEENADDTPFG